MPLFSAANDLTISRDAFYASRQRVSGAAADQAMFTVDLHNESHQATRARPAIAPLDARSVGPTSWTSINRTDEENSNLKQP